MKEPIVDWFYVVNDLIGAGMSINQQAKDVGVCRQTVGYWRAGQAEPSFSHGYTLIEIYRTVLGTTPQSKDIYGN